MINQQLQLVYDWIVSNKMQLNFRKSKVMWFSASLKKLVSLPEVVVSDKVLEIVDTCTQLYLGLMFDSKLSWESQVSNVCKKMSYYTYLLTCQRHILNDELKRLLVDSLVSSHLTYALCVWGPSSLSSDCRDCRTVLFGFVLALGNMKEFGSIITNCNGYLFQN